MHGHAGCRHLRLLNVVQQSKCRSFILFLVICKQVQFPLQLICCQYIQLATRQQAAIHSHSHEPAAIHSHRHVPAAIHSHSHEPAAIRNHRHEPAAIHSHKQRPKEAPTCSASPELSRDRRVPLGANPFIRLPLPLPLAPLAGLPSALGLCQPCTSTTSCLCQHYSATAAAAFQTPLVWN